MKRTITLFVIISFVYSLPAQDNELFNQHEHHHGQCINAEQSQRIKSKNLKNIQELHQQGIIDTNSYKKNQIVFFDWPLKKAAGFTDPSYYFISNYVDHDSGSGLLDYTGGTKTYDGHNGTDILTWPFKWDKMTNNSVEVIAGADGTIIGKNDGNPDDGCDWNGTGTPWNAIYIQHSDGSVAWYGHLKNGTITSKNVGQTVTSGEYLGVVGSSGFSTDPHLHFEVYSNSAQTNLIDPFGGPFNGQNGNQSWWSNQKPYVDPAILKLMTGDAVFTQSYGCPAFDDNPHQQSTFDPGDNVYFSSFFRDQMQGSLAEYSIIQPNGVVWNDWDRISSSDYIYGSSWADLFPLPSNAMTGVWKFQCTFNGSTEEVTFNVTGVNQANLRCSNNGNLTISNSNINISNVQVINDGNASSSSSTLGYYLSTNTIISTGDILIATDFVSSLGIGSTSSESATITPSNIINLPQDGSYYFGSFVDHTGIISESNESDNSCVQTSPQITIGCTDNTAHNYNSLANFSNSNCQTCTDGIQNGDEIDIDCGGVLCNPCSTPVDLVMNSCPNIIVNDRDIYINNINVSNSGTTNTGNFSIGYFLSTNSFISNSDYFIGSSIVNNIGPSSNIFLNKNFNIDPEAINLPSGKYYIGILLDYDNQINESDEANNNDCYTANPEFGSTHVTNAADNGFGTLREAIICSNAHIGSDTISFNISGSSIIQVDSSLPFLTDQATIIDATTQPSWSLGSVVLDGSNAGNAYGIVFFENDAEVYGMKIQNFVSTGLFVQGNNVQIGDINKGNVLVNNNFGIELSSSNNVNVYNNHIGILEDGTTPFGNDNHGIRSYGCSDITIGSIDKFNIIGANNAAGIGIGQVGQTDSDYIIQSNYIGTDQSGNIDLGNNNSGIDKQPTAIVSNVKIYSNTIAYNGIYGIWAYDAECTLWDPYLNSFFCNLSGDIVMDSGANNGILPPTIVLADNTKIEIQTQAGYFVELRSYDNSCVSYPCQGKTLIGQGTADSNGFWTYNGEIPVGTKILATNSLQNGANWSTSAFSNCSITSNCQSSINISTNYTGIINIESSNTIITNGTIQNGETTLDGGTQICLNSGFEVIIGAQFEAYNDGCGNNGNEP